jgi:hypothetical protein
MEGLMREVHSASELPEVSMVSRLVAIGFGRAYGHDDVEEALFVHCFVIGFWRQTIYRLVTGFGPFRLVG